MTITPEQKIKRALWLAFNASKAVGMGFLHMEASLQQTEDSLFEACRTPEKLTVYTDYCFGRMMKTSFEIDENDNLVINPEEPRWGYQSWADTYPTASLLIEAVYKSLEA